jgi:radical SAM superfamily enzyme
VILGLPFETKEMMLQTVDYVGKSGADGIKLQLLHILKNTDLETKYLQNKFETLTLESYIDILMDAIRILPKDMVIHRLTGDGAKRDLVAPLWSADKKNVLNTINKALKENEIIQGSKLL